MEIIRITKNLAEISVREIMENVVLAFNLSNTDQKNNLQTGGRGCNQFEPPLK